MTHTAFAVAVAAVLVGCVSRTQSDDFNLPSQIGAEVADILASEPSTEERWRLCANLMQVVQTASESGTITSLSDAAIDDIASLLAEEPRCAAFALETIGPQASRAVPAMEAAIVEFDAESDGRMIFPSMGRRAAICQAIPAITGESSDDVGSCEGWNELAENNIRRAERDRFVFDFIPSFMPQEDFGMPDITIPARIAPDEARATLHGEGGETVARVIEEEDATVLLYEPRGSDPQSPHDRDELYIVVAGTGVFVRGEERVSFSPGDLLYVGAHVPHHFEDFSDDFSTWVVFYGPQRPAS